MSVLSYSFLALFAAQHALLCPSFTLYLVSLTHTS